jgi:hypothetical protein
MGIRSRVANSSPWRECLPSLIHHKPCYVMLTRTGYNEPGKISISRCLWSLASQWPYTDLQTMEITGLIPWRQPPRESIQGLLSLPPFLVRKELMTRWKGTMAQVRAVNPNVKFVSPVAAGDFQWLHVSFPAVQH